MKKLVEGGNYDRSKSKLIGLRQLHQKGAMVKKVVEEKQLDQEQKMR